MLKEPVGPQVLLPWQILLLAWILGLFAVKYFLVSFCTLFLLCALKRMPVKPFYCFLSIISAFCIGLGLGAWLLPQTPFQATKWMQERQKVNIQGQVERIRGKPEQRLRMILSNVFVQVPGQGRQELGAKLVWTWLNPGFRPAPGQLVKGRFKIKPVHGYANPGTWNSEFYWATRGVGYKAFTKGEDLEISCTGSPGFFWSLREKVRNAFLAATLPGKGSALLQALLLGDKYNLDYTTLDLVRRASLAHTLALSGLHLGFVVSMAWLMAWGAGRIYPGLYLWVPRSKLAVFLAAPLVLGYMWLGQASFSLQRAGLMFFFWGLFWFLDRRSILLDGLFAALAIILIFSPLSVFNLGLQFSAVAVAGIAFLGPLLYRFYVQGKKSRPWLRYLQIPLMILGISLIANLALLPLLINSFGYLSPHLYLNLFWLPLLGWLVLPMGLLGLVCLFIPGMYALGAWLLNFGAQILQFMLAALQYLDTHGFLEIIVPLRPLWPEAMGYWLLLGLVPVCLYKKKPLSRALLAVSVLLLILPGLYRTICSTKEQVSLTMLDVGQGQALLLELPNLRRILIDGGGSWNPDYDLGKYVLSPALTKGKSPFLEQVILTHADYDHYRGLYYILEHYAVQKFAFNGQWPKGWEGQRLRKILKERELAAQSWAKDQEVALGNDLALQILHPHEGYSSEKENNNSLVLRLTYRDDGLALLSGDIEARAINSLLASGQELKAQVLILPHHGSKTSYNPEFYKRVDPYLALASAGYLHFFGMPHDQVCKGLQAAGIPLYNTAEHGAVTISWDLSDIEPEIEVERD